MLFIVTRGVAGLFLLQLRGCRTQLWIHMEIQCLGLLVQLPHSVHTLQETERGRLQLVAAVPECRRHPADVRGPLQKVLLELA